LINYCSLCISFSTSNFHIIYTTIRWAKPTIRSDNWWEIWLRSLLNAQISLFTELYIY
jgi:hypothetical protein